KDLLREVGDSASLAPKTPCRSVVFANSFEPDPVSPGNSSVSDDDTLTPSNPLKEVSPTKRRLLDPASLLCLLSFFLTLVGASDPARLSSTVSALTLSAPTLTFLDTVNLAISLRDNAQLLAIAQAHTAANGRPFSSSLNALSRLSFSSLPTNPPDPAPPTLVVARALDLFALPSDPSPSPSPCISPAPPLVLTTPRTVCAQCDSALTLRCGFSDPIFLVDAARPARPAHVAQHECTNPSCRVRHAADHYEVAFERRSVWVWEHEPRYLKVGERTWVTIGFAHHFRRLLLSQCVSARGFAALWNELYADAPDRDVPAGASATGGAGAHESDSDASGFEPETPPARNQGKGRADRTRFKLSSEHVWRSFVVLSCVLAASSTSSGRLATLPRPSAESLVRFANRWLFGGGDVHVLQKHRCSTCMKVRRKRWRGGPATEEERAEGVRWAGSLKKDVHDKRVVEDTQLDRKSAVSFAVCDGIRIGHLLCAYPSCPNPPTKQTRSQRFCPSHVYLHELCGVLGCDRFRVELDDGEPTEACFDEKHQRLWLEFSKQRSATVERGWRRKRPDHAEVLQAHTVKTPGSSESDSDDEVVKLEWKSPKVGYAEELDEHETVTTMWALRRISTLQLLVAACGTPLAWAKFTANESPEEVIGFLSSVHSQLDCKAPAPSSSSTNIPCFPSYIAYDRACDVLRAVALPNAPDLVSASQPAVSGKGARSTGFPPFLSSSRLVVTAFHRQGHRHADALCTGFCSDSPLDGSAPDLVTPYQSISSSGKREKHGSRTFERAFNTSAAEQLNSSLSGFTHLLQSMKAQNYDFLVHVILRDKKLRREREVGSEWVVDGAGDL
ncbi:SPOSA6832_04107, partial [Sporobolomyces salmonicolor]